jgi:hypothetical protein
MDFPAFVCAGVSTVAKSAQNSAQPRAVLDSGIFNETSSEKSSTKNTKNHEGIKIFAPLRAPLWTIFILSGVSLIAT